MKLKIGLSALFARLFLPQQAVYKLKTGQCLAVHTTTSMKRHQYTSNIIWTGNRGEGTSGYRAYDRTWNIEVPGKPVIACSNDPLLGGDRGKMNPEDLLLSALSACHMLWYLHYAADASVVVTAYEDIPVGHGEVSTGGAGRFTSVILRPQITVAPDTDLAVATAIHSRIHEVCFIARSVNFPISHEPTFILA